MVKLELLGWRILIDPDKIEEKTSGGIIMPLSTQDMDQMAVVKGKVVSIGPTAFGKERDESTLKEGDTVHFAKYSGSIVKLNDKEYRIVNDEDLLGIEREE